MIAAIYLSILIVLLDQLSKYLAISTGNYLINTGVAWSLGENLSSYFLLILNLSLISYLVYYFFGSWKANKNLAELLIFAGGLSNVLDRIYWQGVIDFITLKVIISGYEFITPVFNIADIAITLGILWIIGKEFGLIFVSPALR